MSTYKIVRKYQADDVPDETIIEGLTLKQAQKHCSNKQTSSRTATNLDAQRRTEEFGPWFDAYYEE